MLADGTIGLYLGAIALGAVHGILPDHGWPIAAMHSLNKKRTWFHGVASGFILGIGHLVSSIAVVVVYFWALQYFDLTEIHGLKYVAGAVLIALGVREYVRGGHSHDHVTSDGDGSDDGHDHAHDDHGHDHASHDEDHAHAHDDEDHAHAHETHGHAHHDDLAYAHDGHSHDHDHDDHDHDDHAHHDHGSSDQGWIGRLRTAIPFVGSDDAHEHAHSLEEQADQRGLYGIAAFAFLLGFAHNEEIEIIAICTGSSQCLELMFSYAIAVLIAVMTMTLLLIAGFEYHKDRIEKYEGYLPTVTAAVLILMGLAFIVGIF